MSYVQKLLDNIDSLKSKGTDLEIELKFILDPRSAIPRFIKSNTSTENTVSFMHQLIDKFENTDSLFAIEETINFIQRGETNVIKQLVFKKGVQEKDKKNYYTKKPLTQPVYLLGSGCQIPIKFSMAEEKKIQETQVVAELVRSKLRLSIFPSSNFPSLKSWRIDITLVKSLKHVNSVSDLKRIRDGLFPSGLTFENFKTEAPWKFADTIELEIESLDPSNVTEESIHQVDLELGSQIGSFSVENSEYQEKIYEIAKIIADPISSGFRPPSTKGLRNLSNNVIELNRHTFFSELQPKVEEYLITDKADGMRAFLHIRPQKGIAWVVTSKDSKMIEIPTSNLGPCLVDAEQIGNRFLIFDVMLYNGNRIFKVDFLRRMGFIKKVADLSSNFYAKEFMECTANCDISKIVEYFYTRKPPFPYELDGVIFTSKKGNYRKTIIYKWKPAKDTTIDFLARECPKSLLGVVPYLNRPKKILYLLFVGIDTEMLRRLNLEPIHKYKDLFPKLKVTHAQNNKSVYIPIQFSPSSRPYAYLFWSEHKDLDMKIVELHRSIENNTWRLHKIRDDKNLDAKNGIAFGNDFRIAELVWQNYYNPITIDDLKMSKEEGLQSVYFKQHGVDFYKAMRSYNSFVKEQLYKTHEGLNWAIDLAAGKGQDLFRYIRSNIKNVLFMEIDSMALNELVNRKYSFANPKGRQNKDEYKDQSININIMEVNLNQEYQINLDKIKESGIPIPKEGVQLIICNFAIHYMVGNVNMRKNFITLIDKLLAKGGRFIFTTFDGEKVFDLLQENSGKWDKKENDNLKFSIHKDYQSTKFTGNNQKIKVLQPFSENTYYTEYLVNHTLLEKEFKTHKMTQEIFESFSVYQEEFKKHNKTVYDELSELDKTYSALYTISSYYKH
jgi:hypothetical protein